jgi:hypothetical protein
VYVHDCGSVFKREAPKMHGVFPNINNFGQAATPRDLGFLKT